MGRRRLFVRAGILRRSKALQKNQGKSAGQNRPPHRIYRQRLPRPRDPARGGSFEWNIVYREGEKCKKDSKGIKIVESLWILY